MVTTKEIREWMEKQIKARKLQNEILVVEKHEDDLDDELTNLSRTKDIHIQAEAVRYISERLDLDLCVRARRNAEDYPYEIFVIYNGEIFFGLENEEEYKERGAVV